MCVHANRHEGWLTASEAKLTNIHAPRVRARMLMLVVAAAGIASGLLVAAEALDDEL